jgi:PAS domain S-box-containing protein
MTRPVSKEELVSEQQLRARISDLEASVRSLTGRISDYNRVFFENPVASLIYNAESLAIVEANPGAVALYAVNRTQLQSMRVDEFFMLKSIDREIFAAELRKPFNTAGPFHQRAADGRELLVRMSIFPLQLPGIDARIALIQDETASRYAEDALRHSEERYRELFENANEIIFLQDLNGNVQALNRAAESLTGYSRSELLGQNFSRILPAAAWEQLLDNVRSHLGGSPAQRFELPIHSRTGVERYLEVSTRIVYKQGHPVGIQGIGRDITESKLARQRLLESSRELQEKNEELRTALKLAQEATQLKEQFLANTSHELRTPLNGIMGMVNLVKDTDLTLEQREYVDAVSQCSNDLLTIINDLLDMAKIGAGGFALNDQAFDVADSVRSVVTLLRVRASAKGLSLTFTVDPRLPGSIYGDCVRFRQILMNLIANAVKFTGAGGVHLVLSKTADGAWLHGEVRDSGIGVDPAVQERIFEPFFQADGTLRRKYGGTGLGLAICKQLVETMGGHIGTRNNTPDPGATFWFDLPLRTAPLSD